ncbi:ABC transporter ATP-binding protein [Flocculibacter collagenilyticus]|uniref:ABC transporter ATP-binding protein n=1 Tax=Flocculibacter collagenilyticus TaxID=2744479 RepID=UPI0018F48CCA|nr:ABC transporter ATP-binding protein [Flocculibacter collagenilyticus]
MENASDTVAINDKAGKNSAHFSRLGLVKEFAPRLLLGLCIMALTVALQLAFPKAISYFIDNVQQVHQPSWYYTFAIAALVALIIHSVATALRYYLFETAGLLIVTKVRRILHFALINQPIAFYDKHNIGELTNRLSNDVDMLQDTLTMGLAISLRSLLVFIGSIVMLVMISPLMCITLLVLVPASFYAGKWVGDKIQTKSKNIQHIQAMCSKVAHENFSNIKLVHAFNKQNKAKSLYMDETENAYQTNVGYTAFIAKFQGATSFILYLTLLITLLIGANLIAKGSITIGELTSFVIYAGMLTSSVSAISDFWSDWMRAMGATDRIFEIIEDADVEKNKIRNVDVKSDELSGAIQFNNVAFSYPERPAQYALKDISLIIAPGEKVALIGPSGAGKSTIASLLLGYYQANSGSITFDGKSYPDLTVNTIRGNTAIVEQEPSLFCTSILDNIAYGAKAKTATEQEVIQAAKKANAHDFIMSFPEQYNTLVGDRGVQLSGGQKQRIAIARALLRDPKILILDEATSALDSVSERQVQGALDNLMQGRTTVMIAHRYSTIAKADKVFIINNGEIVEQGTHHELSMSKNSFYTELVESQKISEAS